MGGPAWTFRAPTHAGRLRRRHHACTKAGAAPLLLPYPSDPASGTTKRSNCAIGNGRLIR